MRLKFIKPDDVEKNVKCSIHKSGKLGFSSGAIKKLDISINKSISIAINEDEDSDKDLYAVVNEDVNKGAFKFSKAGDYFYVNTKSLFDSLGIDYRNKKIIYDIIDFEYKEIKMYKLIKRTIEPKDKN